MHSTASRTGASSRPSFKSQRWGHSAMPVARSFASFPAPALRRTRDRLAPSGPGRPSHAGLSACARDARGMTLIELMVAMTLGMLVLGVVTTIFSGTSGNRASLERGGRLAENVAYAVEVLSDEVRMAGFFAETNFTGVA